MSRLAYFSRPWVAFDSSNKEHRRYFAEFQRTGTWGRCPVRFIIPDDSGDLITMIQRRLIDFYVQREFHIVENNVIKLDKKSKKSYNTRIAER